VANHLACLGFPIKSEPGFMKLVERALRFGEDAGDYVLWKPCHGLELWLPMNEDDCVGLNPHYRGEGRIAIAKATFDATDEGATLLGEVAGNKVAAAVPNYPLWGETEQKEIVPPCAVQFALFAAKVIEEPGPALVTDGEIARACGVVLLAEVLENTDTENPFVHLVLQTASGNLDVVAEAEIALPLVGSTVTVSGWLSGLIP
jgi:hypothetical protein